MHAGINCIQAQHSRAWHLTMAAVIGRLVRKDLAQDRCHAKTEYIKAHSDHKKCIKEQKRSFWTILHFFADLRVHTSRHPRFHIPVWEFRGGKGNALRSDFLICPILTISDHSLLEGNAYAATDCRTVIPGPGLTTTKTCIVPIITIRSVNRFVGHLFGAGFFSAAR